MTYDRDVLFKPVAHRMRRGEPFIVVGPYTLALLGNKSFSIRRRGSHHVKHFFDISGFFADNDHTLPLDEVSQVFLGLGKLPDVDRARLGNERGYYAAHRDDVIRYCRRDAQLALRLGKLLVSTLQENLGFYPSRFNSKASVSKAWAEVLHPELLETKKLHRRSIFRSSYRGGLFLTRILGRVENVTEVDITKAYGDSLRKVPRMDVLTRRMSRVYHPDALLGAYQILIDYDGRLPLDARLRGKKRGRVRVTCPDSNGALRPYTASKAELEYFNRSRREVKVLLAEEYFGEYVPQFPEVEHLLDKCTTLKPKAETDPRARVELMLFKTIINSLYGCLAESRHGETPLTCWPLAAEISGRTRVKVWEEWDRIEADGGIIVSINTDSLRFVPGKPWTPTGTGPGEFELKFVGATVTHYQSGIAIIEEVGKAPKLRKRGKPLLTVELLRAARGSTCLVPSKAVTHLFQALAQHNVEEIGVFDDPNDPEDDRTINLESNLFALDFPAELLRFEALNERPVIGTPPDFDEITRGRYRARAPGRASHTKPQTSVAPGRVRHRPDSASPSREPPGSLPRPPSRPAPAWRVRRGGRSIRRPG
ncbi:MAG TPA: hypothetical protein VGV89_03285 [Thermoplasmata archaeon]|nr:hypothetical protein [Thermoplasmata archaeon]